MIDKIESKIYTDVGVIKMVKENINNVPTVAIFLNDKIEFIVKQLSDKSDNVLKATAVIYYDNNEDLTKFLHSNNIEDVCKIKEENDEFKNVKIVIIPDNLMCDSFSQYTNFENILAFIKADAEGRTEMLNKVKIECEKISKHIRNTNEFVVKTIVGDLIFKKNNENFPNGLTIKLNNAPVALLEEIKNKTGENKLVLKRYPNKNIINDDDYFNTESYGIDFSKIAKTTIDAILEDIEK